MTDRTTYFGRELAETRDAEREQFMREHIDELAEQWPELWTCATCGKRVPKDDCAGGSCDACEENGIGMEEIK